MLFHPNKLELATSGNDGFVKVWTFIQENPLTSKDFIENFLLEKSFNINSSTTNNFLLLIIIIDYDINIDRRNLN